MATRCDLLTEKEPQYGKRVSHAKNRTNHRWNLNIQKKTFVFDGQKVTMHLSTQAIRTLKKKGII
jgi:large subunit ribosomal protein L28